MAQRWKHKPIVEKSFVLGDLFDSRRSDLLEATVKK